MNIEDYEWLGIIYPNDIKPGVALITPLAYYYEDKWHPIPQDKAISCFPNNGKGVLFAKDFPASKNGQLRTFWFKRNPSINNLESSKHSHYMVDYESASHEVAQIFDWTSLARQASDLSVLLDKGISQEIYYCHQMYVRYQHYLYGPIRLELDRQTNLLKPREYIQSSNTGGQPLLISVYAEPKDGVLLLGDIPNHFYTLSHNMLKSPIKQEDWSQPQVVMKRILKASKEVLPHLEQEVRLVDRHISELARLSSQNGPSALRLEQATFERGQYIVNYQIANLQNLRNLIEHLPAEHPLLQKARELEIQQRKFEIEQQAQTRIEEQTAHLAQLQRDVQAIQVHIQEEQAHLQSLQHDIQTIKEQKIQAQKELETFEHEVHQRLTKLREEPLQVFAELQTTLSLFPALGQNGHHNNEFQTYASYPLATSVVPYDQQAQQRRHAKNVISWIVDNNIQAVNTEFCNIPKNFWLQFAQRFHMTSKEIRACVAALISGFVPILSGEAGLSLARAVAQAITGGRVWSVPVPLTALTPLDLFGTINLEKQNFIPSSGSLADIILQANLHPQELALVILEGIDRVPGMSVSFPLLRQYKEIRHTNPHMATPLPLNLFHPSALDTDDPYQQLAWFIWPSNLLLVVTSDDDISSMPLPTMYESWFVRIEANFRSTASSTSSSTAYHVSFGIWQRWQKEMQSTPMKKTDYEEELSTQQKRFSKALHILHFSEADVDHVIEQAWPQQFGSSIDTEAEGVY